jgi:hypothetical protein
MSEQLMLGVPDYCIYHALFESSNLIPANDGTWLCRSQTRESLSDVQLFLLVEEVEEFTGVYCANATVKGIEGFQRGQIDRWRRRDVVRRRSYGEKCRIKNISRKEASGVRSWSRFEKFVA